MPGTEWIKKQITAMTAPFRERGAELQLSLLQPTTTSDLIFSQEQREIRAKAA